MTSVPVCTTLSGLKSQYSRPALVHVGERGQDLEHVGQRLLGGHRLARVAHRLERPAAEVLHDDVGRGVVPGHHVVDAHDARVHELGEEPLLRVGRGERGGVAGVQQALEDDPAVADLAVARQVHPAEAAVREGAEDLVLAGDEVARPQRRGERERVPHCGQNPSVRPGRSVAAPPDRLRRTPRSTGSTPAPRRRS